MSNPLDLFDTLFDVFIVKTVTEADCNVLADRIRAVDGVEKLDLGFRTTVSFSHRPHIAKREVLAVIADWASQLPDAKK